MVKVKITRSFLLGAKRESVEPATEAKEDEDDIDETTNVRKKQSKRTPISDHQSRSKAIARRKKRYNLQFTFDADVRCAITIYYFCTEDITPQVKICRIYVPFVKTSS